MRDHQNLGYIWQRHAWVAVLLLQTWLLFTQGHTALGFGLWLLLPRWSDLCLSPSCHKCHHSKWAPSTHGSVSRPRGSWSVTEAAPCFLLSCRLWEPTSGIDSPEPPASSVWRITHIHYGPDTPGRLAITLSYSPILKKFQFRSETHFYPSSNEIQGKMIACWTYTWIPIYLSIHMCSQNTLICMQVIYVIYDIYCDIDVLCNIYAGICLPIYHHKKFPNMSTIFYFTLMRPILPQFFKCIYDLPHAKPCAMCQEYEVE